MPEPEIPVRKNRITALVLIAVTVAVAAFLLYRLVQTAS